jgi:hypothetical protein
MVDGNDREYQELMLISDEWLTSSFSIRLLVQFSSIHRKITVVGEWSDFDTTNFGKMQRRNSNENCSDPFWRAETVVENKVINIKSEVLSQRYMVQGDHSNSSAGSVSMDIIHAIPDDHSESIIHSL